MYGNGDIQRKRNKVVVLLMLQPRNFIKTIENLIQRGHRTAYIWEEIRNFCTQLQVEEEDFLDYLRFSNDPYPFWFLGFFYEWGIGTEINASEGFRLYQQAAQQNSDIGQLFSGYCFESGIGTDPDPSEAFHYFQISANQQNSCAEMNLARCYRYGIGIKKDLRCSIFWNKIAILHGNITASDVLAKCYMYGFGVSKNLFNAIHLLRRTNTEWSHMLLDSLFHNKQSIL